MGKKKFGLSPRSGGAHSSTCGLGLQEVGRLGQSTGVAVLTIDRPTTDLAHVDPHQARKQVEQKRRIDVPSGHSQGHPIPDRELDLDKKSIYDVHHGAD